MDRGPRGPLIQMYFCEICKLEEEPKEIEVLMLLEKCGCGLILLCKDKCAKQKWPEHEVLCQKRQKDWKKWDEFAELFEGGLDGLDEKTYYGLGKEFGQHRFNLAFETLELAERKQELYGFQEALRVFEYAITKREDATAFHIQRSGDDYPGAKIAAAYLYLLLILGKADVIQKKFVEAKRNVFEFFGMALGAPMRKKRHFFAKIAEILMVVMQAKVPEEFDAFENFETFKEVMKISPEDSVQQKLYNSGIPMDLIRKHLVKLAYNDFVEGNYGIIIYGRLKNIFHRISKKTCFWEENLLEIICGKDLGRPLQDIGKMILEVGQILRKYFQRYPNKTAFLNDMLTRTISEIGEGEESNDDNEATVDNAGDDDDWSDVDSDDDLGSWQDEDFYAYIDFNWSFGIDVLDRNRVLFQHD